jgi:hypothetical protein
MNDTDVKLDEAAFAKAVAALHAEIGPVYDETRARQFIRAYLAATKPPLAGEVVEWPPIIELGKTLAFYTSVIKSGESWSPECAAAYDRANKALQDLYAALTGRGEGFVLVPAHRINDLLGALRKYGFPVSEAATRALVDGGSLEAQAVHVAAMGLAEAMLAASRTKEDTQQ